MHRSSLNPAIYQQFIDSLVPSAVTQAATLTGQAQYLTPTSFASTLAGALPRLRTSLCDLTCGTGNLLRAAADHSTLHHLGIDLDPTAITTAKSQLATTHHLAPADLTLFAQLLHNVEFYTDLFLLNPPWNLPWRAERFAFLADSHLPEIRAAYTALCPAPRSPSLDSTLATLLLALHFSTDNAEGFLIANAATIDRLILAPDAPAAALLPFIWGSITLPGNPCDPAASTTTRFGTPMRTTILYFSRKNPPGRRCRAIILDSPTADLRAAAYNLQAHRREAGLGLNLTSKYDFYSEAPALWKAALEEYQRLHSTAAKKTPRYNLWLAPNGTIQTHLSLYQQRASRILAAQAAALHKLNGKSPFALVTQRAERNLLLQHTGLATDPLPAPCSTLPAPPPWLVDPALQTAVRTAVDDYHSQRAPLVPLPKIQRLGYLEEEDTILCERTLSLPCSPLSTPNPQPLFLPSHRYPLRTQSVQIKRTTTRYNSIQDCDETIEYTGQELATFITAEDNQEYCFMEDRLKNSTDTLIAPVHRDGREHSSITIHFTLQQLAAHFHIPEVPDRAALHPAAYHHNLEQLLALQTLANSMK